MEYFNLRQLGLPEDVWQPFARDRASIRREAGQLLYLEDTQADCFYYLRSGRVKTFISSEAGGERILNIYGTGNLLGEAAFLDGLPRVSSAVTLTECQVIPITRDMAARDMAENPELTLSLLKYLALTVRLLSSHVDDMAFLSAEQRVVRFLLSLPQDDGGNVRCTQEEIASSISASRVTVSRILSRLARDGTVRTGYGGLSVLNAGALEVLASFRE